jgi:hypothetical protein
MWSVLVNGKKDYARHPGTLRWKGKLRALFGRHEALIHEMALRGYRPGAHCRKRVQPGSARQRVFIQTLKEAGGILITKRCLCNV